MIRHARRRDIKSSKRYLTVNVEDKEHQSESKRRLVSNHNAHINTVNKVHQPQREQHLLKNEKVPLTVDEDRAGTHISNDHVLVELEEKKQHWPKRIGCQTKKEEVDLFDKDGDINKINNNVSDKNNVEEKRKGRQTSKRKVNLLDEEFVVDKDSVHEKSEKEEREHYQPMKKKKVDTNVNNKNEEEDKNEELLPKRKRCQSKKKEVDLLDDEKGAAELDNDVSDKNEEPHVGEQYQPTRKGRQTIKGKMNPLNKESVVEGNDVCDKSEERQYCRPKRNRRQPGWRKVFQLIEGDEIEELDGISGQSSVEKKNKDYLPLQQEEDEDFQFQEEKELQPQKKKRGHPPKHCSSPNPGSICTIQRVADKNGRDRHTHIGHKLPSEVASSSQKAALFFVAHIG
ncbi:hypothetical protein Pcinc_007786 [Petrolisthes cinctipes]|uniref:Uncharacterized protein n=1 Tax=Petrolisthes cinctipes TaxID=88211 RepID=A0AAE1KWJ9_PETCI|nr:hypothetical protein Pcinc_007786 [Petrolisthes cinctipes]